MVCSTHLPRTVAAVFTGGALLFGGCASTRLDAQWADPQTAPSALRGAHVLVACEAREAVIQRLCQDRLADEVVARGGTPVLAPSTARTGGPVGDEQYLSAARNAGARAVLASTVTTAGIQPRTGVSVGIGGFGIGSGGFGAGIGVSAPLGGGQATTGYAVNSRILDAGSGRLLWTARASTPPSGNVQLQMSELAKAVFGAADKANLF
ncbi:hypothetical protein [Piscinibacter sp.]|uniref:hypothetical protein n=1 Tax=Piscinibacter sp. TaxID=1903157 RepID=UPI002D0D24C0|nr:hypothetical protein [Albitalea sp.]HUG23935.1 hypothetical protein [Albitalea sp.]